MREAQENNHIRRTQDGGVNMSQTKIASTATVTEIAPTASDSTAQTNERFADRSDARAYSSKDESRCWNPGSSSRVRKSSGSSWMPGAQSRKTASTGSIARMLNISLLLIIVAAVLMIASFAMIAFGMGWYLCVLVLGAVLNVAGAAFNVAGSWKAWKRARMMRADVERIVSRFDICKPDAKEA